MRSLKPWVLALLCATLLMSSSEGASAGHPRVRHRTMLHQEQRHAASSRHAMHMVTVPGTYATGALAGHTVTDLYADWIGYKGVLPARLRIDWHHQLSVLWKRKVERSHGTLAINQLANRLATEYRTKNPERMTIRRYAQIADQQAALLRRSTDWNDVARLYRLSPQQVKALRAKSARINGRVLISYALTELMPGRTNGAFNAEFLDFLLRNAGRRYVESLPALNDGKLSFGPYQFTDQALFDAGGTHRGASKFNQAVRLNVQIPRSTMYLRGNDHFRAAYLFALNNMAETVRKMNKRELATFGSYRASSGAQLAQSIAVAHNKPTTGRRGELRWLSNHARLPFPVSLSGASRIYATKTGSNYQALNRD